MRARYYDPGVGRFLGEDPAGFTSSINLYAYVDNSPTNFTDPLGLIKTSRCRPDLDQAIENAVEEAQRKLSGGCACDSGSPGGSGPGGGGLGNKGGRLSKILSSAKYICKDGLKDCGKAPYRPFGNRIYLGNRSYGPDCAAPVHAHSRGNASDAMVLQEKQGGRGSRDGEEVLRTVTWATRSLGSSSATVTGLLVAVSLLATEAVAQPSRSDLATVWVGGAPEEPLEYFRLELDANGTGILTVQYLPGKPAVAYRVLSTSLSGYTIGLQTEPMDAGVQPIQVRGEAIPSYLRLRVVGRAPDWKLDIQLQRYDSLLERIRAVTERAEAHTRATR